MRTFICRFVMLSVLFMNAEAAVAVASDSHPYDDDLMHQIDATKSSSNDTSSNLDLENAHCVHCYHGHVVGITPHFLAVTAHLSATENQRGETPHVLNYAQAPPTPPPNT
jgi:hypothetical protein